VPDILEGAVAARRGGRRQVRVAEAGNGYLAAAADLSPAALAQRIAQLEAEMLEHARNLEFEQAAALRDAIADLKRGAFAVPA
jgi:excinuclease ABC subunit B